MRALLSVLAVVAMMGLAGCSGGGHGPAHDADEKSVTIDGFSFSPATLTVKQGDTVTIHNEHNVKHTVTLVSGERDTGDIAPGGHASITLPTMGTHAYKCKIHPQMQGTFIVQEP